MLLAAVVNSQTGVTGTVKLVRNRFYCYQVLGNGAISLTVLFQKKTHIWLLVVRTVLMKM